MRVLFGELVAAAAEVAQVAGPHRLTVEGDGPGHDDDGVLEGGVEGDLSGTVEVELDAHEGGVGPSR